MVLCVTKNINGIRSRTPIAKMESSFSKANWIPFRILVIRQAVVVGNAIVHTLVIPQPV